jgi:GNAT superfamily N-acetyltransferase
MDQLEIIAPDPKRHLEPLLDMYGKVFSGFMNYYDAVQAGRERYFGNSHYDWGVSRIGLLGERVVTHYGVWDYQMRIGTARVRMGGVGGVATAEEVRKQGLMTKTATACLEAMREQGYDMTMLFGIPGFYHRFGYVRAWSDTDFLVRTSNLPTERPAARLRRFKPMPRPDLAHLYNRHHRTVTGTAVRPTYLRGFPAWMELDNGYMWGEEGASPSGYVILRRRRNRLDCLECCGDADEILRALGLLARQWCCEQVKFETLPYFGEVAKRLRRGYCRIETEYHGTAHAMARMVNLPATLKKLAGELSRRLRSSPLADWVGDLLIADPRDQAVLHIANGSISSRPAARTPHAIRGGEEIVQLLLGTHAPEETVEAAGIRLSGDAKRLLPILFPEQRPQLSALDRY